MSHACTTCEAGYYCPSSGTILSTRRVCSTGGYCPQGSHNAVSCPAGTFSSASGQATSATCEACLEGTYCPTAGTTTGISCPAHHYCPTGTMDYSNFPCPPGTYSESTGLHSASQCLNCTVGSYCPGDVSPIMCPAGTYNAFDSGSSLSICRLCEAGYSCPQPGMTHMTTLCSPGYYCPQGTVYPTQNPCPAGTYSDSSNLVSVFGCSQCPERFSSEAGSTSSTLTSCRPGSYCPTGTAFGNEIPCPAGTYSNSTHLKSSMECSPCPPGSFCSGGQVTVSGICPPGYFCPSRTSYAVEHPCPAGFYSPNLGLQHEAQCLSCEQGHFCLEGSSSMLKCPPGTYSSVNNTVSGVPSSIVLSCNICPGGHFCKEGAIEAFPCGRGKYSDVGEESCQVCPRGSYCGSNTTTLESLSTGGQDWLNSGDLSGICFNGTYCDLGMSVVPDLLRYPCPAGYYCPAGIEFPVPCPAGKYSGSVGQDRLESCVTTPAGQYSIAASTKPNGLCYPGYYCPAGSSSSIQIPCPARTYRSELGGTSIADCPLCVAGGYCPRATAEPIVCPRGHACPSGVSEPEPCNPGTYGNSTGLKRLEDCISCDSGSYCDSYGLTAPKGLCTPGFFCLSGSTSSSPQSDASSVVSIGNSSLVSYLAKNLFVVSSKGGICPSGSYCPLGSGTPTVLTFLEILILHNLFLC